MMRGIGSTHNGFCHEDIWLAKAIRIRHHAHYHVALFLVKLKRMPREVLDLGHVLPDMGKEIDPSKRGLPTDIIGAKRNGQPSSLSYALFQVIHQSTPNA